MKLNVPYCEAINHDLAKVNGKKTINRVWLKQELVRSFFPASRFFNKRRPQAIIIITRVVHVERQVEDAFWSPDRWWRATAGVGLSSIIKSSMRQRLSDTQHWVSSRCHGWQWRVPHRHSHRAVATCPFWFTFNLKKKKIFHYFCSNWEGLFGLFYCSKPHLKAFSLSPSSSVFLQGKTLLWWS